jgi:hypothetical protein
MTTETWARNSSKGGKVRAARMSPARPQRKRPSRRHRALEESEGSVGTRTSAESSVTQKDGDS